MKKQDEKLDPGNYPVLAYIDCQLMCMYGDSEPYFLVVDVLSVFHSSMSMLPKLVNELS